MILSNNISTSIEVVLSGAVTTNQLKCVATWMDTPSADFASGQTATNTNNTTAVTLVPAVTATFRREVSFISIYNNDTVSATVTVQINIGGTSTTIIKVTLASGSTLIYSGSTWQVIASDGSVPPTANLTRLTFMFVSSAVSPADATTYYFGNSVITTTAANVVSELGYDVTVIGAIITATGNTTAGSTETATIKLRNVTTLTSHTISTSVRTDASTTVVRSQTVTGLSIDVAASDDICIEYIAPTYATNPVALAFRVILICKLRT